MLGIKNMFWICFRELYLYIICQLFVCLILSLGGLLVLLGHRFSVLLVQSCWAYLETCTVCRCTDGVCNIHILNSEWWMDSCNSISYPFDIIETCFWEIFSNITIIRGILVFPPFSTSSKIQHCTRYIFDMMWRVRLTFAACQRLRPSRSTWQSVRWVGVQNPLWRERQEAIARSKSPVEMTSYVYVPVGSLVVKLHHFLVKFYKKE